MPIPVQNPLIITAETAFNNLLLNQFRVEGYINTAGQPEGRVLIEAQKCAIVDGKWVQANVSRGRYAKAEIYKEAETDPVLAQFVTDFMTLVAAFNVAKNIV